MKLIQRAATIASCLVLVLCFACGSKINQDNFAKLKSGMTKDEVIAILGKPTKESGGGIAGVTGGGCEWQDGEKKITVMFLNDKASPAVKTGF